MKRGFLYASGTYHSTSTVGYQLRIADLIVKGVQLSKDNIWKGATMQPTPPINKILYVMHNTSHAIKVR
jgi:hypothetical protein